MLFTILKIFPSSKITSTKIFNYDHFTNSYTKIPGKLHVNMCQSVDLPLKCKDLPQSLIVFVPNDSDTCISLLPSDIPEEFFKLLDIKAPLSGFEIYNLNTKFDVKIKCNKELSKPKFSLNNALLVIESAGSCGYINEPARFYNEHRYIVSLIFIIIGTILMLFGGYKWELMIEAFGVLTGITLTFGIFWVFVTYREEPASYVFISIVALILGIVIGYLFRSMVILSYITLGFGTGYFIGRYMLIVLEYKGPDVSL